MSDSMMRVHHRELSFKEILSFENPRLAMETKDREIAALVETIKELRSTRSRELAEAYEAGLADASHGMASKVYRDNCVLAATVAALTDPLHQLNLKGRR